MEIIKTLVPTIRRIVAIYPAADVSALAAVQEAQKGATGLKLEIVSRPVFGAEDVRRILRQSPRRCLPRSGQPYVGYSIRNPRDVCMSRIPAVFPTALWVSHGGLVSYGPDYYSQGVQAARLVAKILQGARPQDLPVEGAEKIDLAISLKTAALLRVNVPRKVLLRADRIYR